MKNLITKTVIFSVGAFCGFVFLGININWFTPYLNRTMSRHEYGDLYYHNYLDLYRTEKIARKKAFMGSGLNSSLDDAGIILFGDSNCNLRYFKGLPEILMEKLNLNLHFGHFRVQGNPLVYLRKKKYKNPSKKIFVYQTGERAISNRLGSFPKKSLPKPSLKKDIKKFLKKIYPKKQGYEFFIKDSKFTNGLYRFVKNKRYEWFGYVDAPNKRDEKSGMLFIDKTTDNSKLSFYYPYTDEEIEKICINLDKTSKQLKSEFDLDLIFLPVPSKYTIYHNLINDDEYNGLLPKLYECLDAKGVDYINLYTPYKESDELLYYKTDTHWNEKGVKIASDLLIQKIREIQKTTN